MAAVVTGSKTVSNSVSPALSASALTALMAIAVENLTLAQFKQLARAITHVSGGGADTATLGTLLV